MSRINFFSDLLSFYSATTLIITTLSLKGLYVTQSINGTLQNNTLLFCRVLLCWVPHFIHHYAECRYDKFHGPVLTCTDSYCKFTAFRDKCSYFYRILRVLSNPVKHRPLMFKAFQLKNTSLSFWPRLLKLEVEIHQSHTCIDICAKFIRHLCLYKYILTNLSRFP